MIKKIIYIDLDGVVADFNKGRKDHPLGNITPYIGKPYKLPGLYENLEPIKNSIESVNKILNHPSFELFFLSTAPWENSSAWSDKNKWVKRYLGKSAYKQLILSHNKHLNIGDYLIDDRTANGAGQFTGEHIHFGSPQFPKWQSVLDYLL